MNKKFILLFVCLGIFLISMNLVSASWNSFDDWYNNYWHPYSTDYSYSSTQTVQTNVNVNDDPYNYQRQAQTVVVTNEVESEKTIPNNHYNNGYNYDDQGYYGDGNDNNGVNYGSYNNYQDNYNNNYGNSYYAGYDKYGNSYYNNCDLPFSTCSYGNGYHPSYYDSSWFSNWKW